MARCPDPQSAALLRHALVLIGDAGTTPRNSARR